MNKYVANIAVAGLMLVSTAFAQSSYSSETRPDGTYTSRSEQHYNFGSGATGDVGYSNSSSGAYENSSRWGFPNGSSISSASERSVDGTYTTSSQNHYNFGGGHNGDVGYSNSSSGAYENSSRWGFPNGAVQSSVSGVTDSGNNYHISDNTYVFGKHVTGRIKRGHPGSKMVPFEIQNPPPGVLV